ncbi:MAG TPA: hypothetical protein VHV10_15535 [Ktedonobacteraceae bacterium]|jgi:hypothetical protein|nr:hypothetical protein [Ktedonobacteraceae bacterium]
MEEDNSIPDKKISASQVAIIWNKRAKEERGITARYTRYSVRSRRDELDGEETPLGWLYSERKARSITLRPRSTGRKDRAEANKTPFVRKEDAA